STNKVCEDSTWQRHLQSELIWELLIPAWEFSNMGKLKLLPMTRETEQPPAMWLSRTANVLLEMRLRIKLP
ncbi:unnamed protein product, partial [Allacma fusca]